MGKIEKTYTKTRKRVDLQRIILDTVATAGVISVGLMAPNALGAMAKLGLLPHRRQKDSIRTARDNLMRQGLLRYDNGKLRLTALGERKLYLLRSAEHAFSKPRKWDKRWRVLIFDIPERRKGTREKIRRTLSFAGFMRLQDSVWVCPYDCEDFITLLKADFKIVKDMLYMIVDVIEYDMPLRKHFGL